MKIMLNKFIILFAALITFNVCAQTANNQAISIEHYNKQIYDIQNELNTTNKDFELVKKELDLLSKQVSSQNSNTDSSFNKISNQIDVAAYSQNLIMGLFTILAIALGVYVTYVEHSVKRLKTDNENLLEETRKIRDETQNINNNINNNFNVIYKKIKEEETIDLLNRIVKTPEDIVNLHPLLATRELHSDKHLDLIKKTFENEKKLQNTNTRNLRFHISSLVLQHFSNRFFIDDFCTSSINDFPSISGNFYDNEIHKLCDDFFNAVAFKEFSEYANYFKSIVNGILNRQISDSSSLHPDLNYLFSKFLSNKRLVDEMFKIEIHEQRFEIFCDEFKKINNIDFTTHTP